jgi:conjugal transfer pilus assembly protein TraF
MVKLLIKFILFVIILFLLDFVLLNSLSKNDAHARKPSYCEEYGLGFNFYCQDEKKEPSTSPEEKKSTPENQDDYTEKLEEVQQTLKNKKAKAVMYPTEDNIKDYMAYQQLVLNQASTFADQWRRVIWKTPELDYTLKRPVSKVGKESWIDKRNSDVASAVRNINDRYGIFFLFRGDCPHCHRYSPILKSFQQKYGINIMAVSMDGGSLPEWDKFMVNTGQIAKMGIEVAQVPTTLLFDKNTRKVIMIGSGVLSHSDLEERIYAQTKLEVGDDF